MCKSLFYISSLVIVLLVACQPVRTDTPGTQIPSPSFQEQNLSPDMEKIASFSSPTIMDTAEYVVQERMVLVNRGQGQPAKQNLWVALISDIDPYQQVIKRVITPRDYQVVTDEYGNQIAEFDFSKMPPGSEIEVQIDYEIRLNSLEYDLSNCTGELPDFFISPELHVESNNPQIIHLAGELTEGRGSPCEQIRAFYDYIGDTLLYSYNGNNWGAQAALGEMGADCTEYSSLMMALSRASGIPALYIEGLYTSGQDNRALARTEHAWLEVYLPNIGWTPMDPTLGRSSISREDYFAALPANHIIVSRGRNPSTLRGSSYFSHIYWPGDSTVIKVEDFEWHISKIN